MTNTKVTFLGTGTSHGVPMIGCECDVCTSANPKNRRLRTSLLLESAGKNLLLDCSKDFREQALRYKIENIENVLITHLHADHIFGLDELRVYNYHTEQAIKLYLKEEFSESIKTIFPYMYQVPEQRGGGVTQVENHSVKHGETFTLDNFEITPIDLKHGVLDIFGYRINKFAYLTDCSEIPDYSYKYLENLDLLVLDALRYKKHSTHFNLDEAVLEAEKIGAKETRFIHMSHNLDHETVNRDLPEGMALAYDGLVLTLPC